VFSTCVPGEDSVLVACELYEVTRAFGCSCVGDRNKGPDAGAAQATTHPWSRIATDSSLVLST
jgi:hypothetical protein